MTPTSPELACFHYRPAAWIKVSGPDAASFLQGQFTNDLRRFGPGNAVYGLWLSQKGRVVADSFVMKGAEETEFRVCGIASPAASILKRLGDYLVADEVTLEDETPGWAGVAVLGAGAGAWLAEAALGTGYAFRGRRGAGEGWEWIYPTAERAVVAGRLAGMRVLDADGMERRRIEAGIPAVPADIGPGDLPNEGGLERDAVSETKGCYMGQEIMARLKSKGQVRRRLFRVAWRPAGPAATVPVPLWQDGRRVGELRSAVRDASGEGSSGMAMLVLRELRPDAPLAFDLTGPACVTCLSPSIHADEQSRTGGRRPEVPGGDDLPGGGGKGG